MVGFRQGSFPWMQNLGKWWQRQQCSLKSQLFLWKWPVLSLLEDTSACGLCFMAVIQSGRVQQLPDQWRCVNLSLWLPVFSRILQNIPAAVGFKSTLMTSRWLGMSRLLQTPWAGDAQKWICKCHLLFVFSLLPTRQ